jgi:hypothetical protein
LTDQPPAKPSDLIYEDTGAAAPVVYFDIVGAYGTMNGSSRSNWRPASWCRSLTERRRVKFISSCRIRCTANAAANLRNSPRCGIEDAGAAARQHSGDCNGEAELSGRRRLN